MGKWNFRRRSRRSFYNQYKDPASSYYDSNKPDPHPPDFTEDGIPPWEKRFCSLIGSVPWQKIINVKEYMICHDNVVNWDDSAGEEAFQTAKKCFWAEITGVPYEHSLPDPDKYNDEINWNPNIDSELIKDLERSFFVPDEGEDDHELECKSINKNTSNLVSTPSEEWNPPNNVASDNKSQGWNEWTNDTDNLRNTNDDFHGNNVNQLNDWKNCPLKNDNNPWEQSFSEKNKSAQDEDPWNKVENSKDWHTSGDPWKRHDWGYDPGKETSYQSKDWHSSGDPWKHSSWGYDPGKEKPWGNSGRSYWKNDQFDNRKMNNPGSQWARSGGTQQVRQWRGSGRNGSGWRRSEDQYREQKDSGSRQPSRSWGTWTESRRKREGNHQYATGNKHSRFGESDYQTGHQWR
ncbi:hypothetical protein M5689_020024 [Euphorbia peplus]|nr:hypothetical protein M5689_020024 [Euphorbia peplus]